MDRDASLMWRKGGGLEAAAQGRRLTGGSGGARRRPVAGDPFKRSSGVRRARLMPGPIVCRLRLNRGHGDHIVDVLGAAATR